MEKGKKSDAEVNKPKNNRREPCNDETCPKKHVHSYKTQSHKDECMDETKPVVSCNDLCCSRAGSNTTIPYLPPFQDNSMSPPSQKIREVPVGTSQPIETQPDQNDKTERKQFVYSTLTDQQDKTFDKDKNKIDPKCVVYVSDPLNLNDDKKDKNKTDPKIVPNANDDTNDEKKDKNKTDPKSVAYANDTLTVKPLTDSSSQPNDKTNENDKSSVPINNNIVKNDYPLVELLEKETQTHKQLDKSHYSYANSDITSFTNENDANIISINKNANTNLVVDKTYDKSKRDSSFSLSNFKSSSFLANGKNNKPNKKDKTNDISMPLKEPLQQRLCDELEEPLQQRLCRDEIKEFLQEQNNTAPNENGIASSRSNAVTTVGALKEIPKEEIKDRFCNAEDPCILSFNDITSAAFMIKDGVERTPCIRSRLSEQLGMELFMKMEIMQYTGSFKERGARYALLKLPAQQKKQGVIAASLGNHAQGISYHAHLLGIPATVVMPTAAPIMKIQKCRNFGANVLVQGMDMGEAKKIAMQLSKERNLLYINGYDHPHIMAGQGTIGLEILEQVPNPDAVVIPLGGAGLMAGIATAIKQINPKCMIIGVESDKCPSYSKAVENKSPIYTPCRNTLADGLAVPTVGYNAFATSVSLIDKVVVVKEEWIALGILRLVEAEKCVAEGAGAACLAAILAGHLNELKGKRVVILISGGNIDTTIFGRCLERGLAADGRLIKFTVRVTDAPGGLQGLCDLLARIGVSVKDIMHERAWLKDIFSVEIKCICETRDWNHSVQVKNILTNTYEYVEFVNEPLAVSHY